MPFPLTDESLPVQRVGGCASLMMTTSASNGFAMAGTRFKMVLQAPVVPSSFKLPCGSIHRAGVRKAEALFHFGAISGRWSEVPDSAFRDRMLAATKVIRQDEARLKRQIAGLYAKCAKDMEKEIAKYGEQSLTGRQADVMRTSMRGYVKNVWQEVGHLTASEVTRAAEVGITAQTSMFDDLLHGVGYTSKPSFASVFGRTRDEAVAAVLNGSIYKGKNTALSKRIWHNAALQSGQMEQMIAAAVAEGSSAVRLARDLQAFVNPKAMMPDHWNDIYPCPFPIKVDYNAKRLAVTALNHAYYQGTVMAARDNPFAEFIHWEVSSMHLIYDVCDTYQEHDEGLGIGNYALDNAPLPHPFCRCNWYVDSSKSLEEIGDEVGRWIAGEENARMDRAFGEWEGWDGVANATESGTMNLPEINVLHSKGARHVDNFPILSPDGEENIYLVSGEHIRNVKVFAGKGTHIIIREAYSLAEAYGVPESEWQKAKGIANVEYDGEIRLAELHWYQAKGVGRIEAKLKQQQDGGWWLDDR